MKPFHYAENISEDPLFKECKMLSIQANACPIRFHLVTFGHNGIKNILDPSFSGHRQIV